MVFNGKEGGMIPRIEAKQLLKNYELSPAYSANNNTSGFSFGKTHIDDIFAQSGCKGIRIYYGKAGIEESDAAHMIIVGIDEDGNDMSDLILDLGVPCPDYCASDDTKL